MPTFLAGAFWRRAKRGINGLGAINGRFAGQRVKFAFISVWGLKIEPGLKGLARLRNNVNSPVSGEALHRRNCPFAQPAISGKKRQEFRQHFIGGYDQEARHFGVKRQRILVSSLGRVGKGYPVKRIGKNRLHTALLGVP